MEFQEICQIVKIWTIDARVGCTKWYITREIQNREGRKVKEPMIPKDELEKLLWIIESVSWRKMKKFPLHMEYEYIPMTKLTAKAFFGIYNAVNEYGYLDNPYGQKHKYLCVDGYKYWVTLATCRREPITKYRVSEI